MPVPGGWIERFEPGPPLPGAGRRGPDPLLSRVHACARARVHALTRAPPAGRRNRPTGPPPPGTRPGPPRPLPYGCGRAPVARTHPPGRAAAGAGAAPPGGAWTPARAPPPHACRRGARPTRVTRGTRWGTPDPGPNRRLAARIDGRLDAGHQSEPCAPRRRSLPPLLACAPAGPRVRVSPCPPWTPENRPQQPPLANSRTAVHARPQAPQPPTTALPEALYAVLGAVPGPGREGDPGRVERRSGGRAAPPRGVTAGRVRPADQHRPWQR
jgi:hypothetical protein